MIINEYDSKILTKLKNKLQNNTTTTNKNTGGL